MCNQGLRGWVGTGGGGTLNSPSLTEQGLEEPANIENVTLDNVSKFGPISLRICLPLERGEQHRWASDKTLDSGRLLTQQQ